MAKSSSSSTILSLVYLVAMAHAIVAANTPQPACTAPANTTDADKLQFALNLEFLEAEFFCYGSLGQGLDFLAPNLTLGGPSPIGPRKANLDPLIRQIFEELCYQEIGRIRSIQRTVGGFPRPLYDFTVENFARLFDQVVGYKLNPPFDPYHNTINYLLAAYVTPYIGLNYYVDTIPNLYNYTTKRLAAKLLGVGSEQDAVIRTLLYKIMYMEVEPYNITVAEFTNKISGLMNELGRCGIKDEGLYVPLELGAENRTHSNIISADANSLSYARTPQEILRIFYGTGNESMPGSFMPRGGNGKIARSYLNEL